MAASKKDLDGFFAFLGNFEPIWVFAILIGMVVAYRSPLIIREILTGLRECRRVKAEIARKQEATNRQIAAKREKAAARRARKVER